ncbi:MAG: hypothetical protein J2P57_23515, partial [Acidimicrobiaceae bacterium]|nr:hypothetical protein [Acidimicrobiaceae bacterium]
MDRASAAAWDRADPLRSFRDRFAVDEAGPIYLDGNSLGRVAHPVAAALAEGVEAWAARLVGGWNDWIDLPAAVGDRLGPVVGAGPGQVIVADSTTVNLYKLASAALDAHPGREVIVGDRHDFPTVRYVLQGVAARTGRQLRLVDSDP